MSFAYIVPNESYYRFASGRGPSQCTVSPEKQRDYRSEPYHVGRSRRGLDRFVLIKITNCKVNAVNLS